MTKAPAPGQVRAQRLAHMNGHPITNLKGNIMIDTALLKQIAAETIPESLYQQLEPFLQELSIRYRDAESMIDQLDYLEFYKSRDRACRYDEIRAEFDKHNAPEWPAFARARWPEVDKSFNLELPPGDPDSLPF